MQLRRGDTRGRRVFRLSTYKLVSIVAVSRGRAVLRETVGVVTRALI